MDTTDRVLVLIGHSSLNGGVVSFAKLELDIGCQAHVPRHPDVRESVAAVSMRPDQTVTCGRFCVKKWFLNRGSFLSRTGKPDGCSFFNFFYFGEWVLGIELRASRLRGRRSTTDLNPQPSSVFLCSSFGKSLIWLLPRRKLPVCF